ncbi:MAG: T9SS type A sorting domain-containing protein [Flavobacteriales bacterium]|nr:T9SS type A sorting domain-containing protein [Flavobacteriales bacterium]
MRTTTTLCLLTALLATSISYAQMNSFDSRIDSYVGLRYTCDGSVQPVLRIQNVGGETMTSCDIDILKNGVTNSTFNWILASPAATGQFKQPALPVVSGVLPGDVLEFHILTVNGQPDEGPLENILQVPMTDEKGTADSYRVQVKVLTDNNPGETSWMIKNALGATVAQSPVYTLAGDLKTTELTLSATQCYNFEVYDSAGDGFGESRQSGYAKVFSVGNEVANASGNFAALYRKGVQTGAANGCLAAQLTTVADPLASCGATGLRLNGTNTLYATEVPGANRYQFKFTNVPGQPAYARNIAMTTRSLLLTAWSTLPLKRNRTYNVQVRSSFDGGVTYCAFGASCTISISSTPSAQPRSFEAEVGELQEPVFTVFPNPTADVQFSLLAHGIDAEEPIATEVFDLLGMRVANSVTLSSVEGIALPVVLDKPLASGLYVVRITVGESTTTERLVVR